MKINDIFYFDDAYAEKAQWCNQNNCHIEEIEKDENGRRFQVVENQSIDKSELFRQLRVTECFEVVNRGKVWYDTLTSTQFAELTDWYQAWLDAPATLMFPAKPKWLK